MGLISWVSIKKNEGGGGGGVEIACKVEFSVVPVFIHYYFCTLAHEFNSHEI